MGRSKRRFRGRRKRGGVWKAIKKLQKTARPEIKKNTVFRLPDPTNDNQWTQLSTPIVIYPTVCRQGIDRRMRIGGKVKAKKFDFHAVFRLQSNQSTSMCGFRCLMLTPKFDAPTTGVGTYLDFLPDFISPVDDKLFTVLQDRTRYVSAATQAIGGLSYAQGKLVRWNVRKWMNFKKLWYLEPADLAPRRPIMLAIIPDPASAIQPTGFPMAFGYWHSFHFADN